MSLIETPAKSQTPSSSTSSSSSATGTHAAGDDAGLSHSCCNPSNGPTGAQAGSTSSLFPRTPNDCCAVCLSPIKSVFNCSDPDKIIVETRCKHFFHDSCLLSAKQMKAECPMCRAALTPPTQLFRNSDSNPYPQPTLYHQQSAVPLMIPNNANLRQEVVSAASRARQAVRLALERREQQQGFHRTLNTVSA